mmetsp:Transcript_27033/g.79096  ORF Transcript_27033/g.79096 Transcript_27033/m.79096 type:complete len:476 (-) Transcript_27033:372-1799(-)
MLPSARPRPSARLARRQRARLRAAARRRLRPQCRHRLLLLPQPLRHRHHLRPRRLPPLAQSRDGLVQLRTALARSQPLLCRRLQLGAAITRHVCRRRRLPDARLRPRQQRRQPLLLAGQRLLVSAERRHLFLQRRLAGAMRLLRRPPRLLRRPSRLLRRPLRLLCIALRRNSIFPPPLRCPRRRRTLLRPPHRHRALLRRPRSRRALRRRPRSRCALSRRRSLLRPPRLVHFCAQRLSGARERAGRGRQPLGAELLGLGAANGCVCACGRLEVGQPALEQLHTRLGRVGAPRFAVARSEQVRLLARQLLLLGLQLPKLRHRPRLRDPPLVCLLRQLPLLLRQLPLLLRQLLLLLRHHRRGGGRGGGGRGRGSCRGGLEGRQLALEGRLVRGEPLRLCRKPRPLRRLRREPRLHLLLLPLPLLLLRHRLPPQRLLLQLRHLLLQPLICLLQLPLLLLEPLRFGGAALLSCGAALRG